MLNSRNAKLLKKYMYCNETNFCEIIKQIAYLLNATNFDRKNVMYVNQMFHSFIA